MIDYLFDLEQTYNLNVELLQNILCENFKTKEKSKLLAIVDHIKVLKEKKKKLIDEILKTRSKILVDKQIYEEAKRIHEENETIQTEQEEEIRELVENKFCSVKELEKKFQEVDIYMKKHYPNVYSYEILKIVETNENLINKKSKLTNSIANEKNNITYLISENKDLQSQQKEQSTHIFSVKETKAEEKLDYMLNLFNGKINTLKMIKEKLIALKKDIGSSITKPLVNKRNDNVNLSVIGQRAIKRDNINLNVSNIDDMVQKTPKTPIKNAFFEQTIILNKDNNDTTQFGNYLNKTSDLGVKDQLWDLSVIKKE